LPRPSGCADIASPSDLARGRTRIATRRSYERSGYQLIRSNKFKEAIAVLQLNVEAYPQSSNVYDSLAEAYMDDGDNSRSIANYRKSLQLNPKNGNAVKMLQKLDAP
jgi:Tfp pilus assembly protein PilF